MKRPCTVFTASALAGLAVFSSLGNAHERFDQDRAYGSIQAERERQRALVEAGRDNGSLTWYEKYSINRERARIDALERAALADGRLNRDEYRAIREAQTEATRNIYAESHDGQVRGWWWRFWR
jgi:hypothetical protein